MFARRVLRSRRLFKSLSGASSRAGLLLTSRLTAYIGKCLYRPVHSYTRPGALHAHALTQRLPSCAWKDPRDCVDQGGTGAGGLACTRGLTRAGTHVFEARATRARTVRNSAPRSGSPPRRVISPHRTCLSIRSKVAWSLRRTFKEGRWTGAPISPALLSCTQRRSSVRRWRPAGSPGSDPDEKYKLSLFLQLESEAKVRLRPLLARHGIPLVEDETLRADGAAAAAGFLSWRTRPCEPTELPPRRNSPRGRGRKRWRLSQSWLFRMPRGSKRSSTSRRPRIAARHVHGGSRRICHAHG